MVQTAVESGLQFTAHSVGDGAVHALLEAYEEVGKGRPIRQTRPCITHCNFMSKEAVEKMVELGVVADIQPAWLYLDTRTLVKQFGDARLRYFQPLRSIFMANGIAGGGSDHMQKIGSLRAINPYNPFLGMATAVTRQAKWHDKPLHLEEALSRPQAIRFYTANNAYLLFREHEVGTLEAGKFADFIVVDTDLLACPDNKIAGTQVLETWLGGRGFSNGRSEIASYRYARGRAGEDRGLSAQPAASIWREQGAVFHSVWFPHGTMGTAGGSVAQARRPARRGAGPRDGFRSALPRRWRIGHT